MLVIKIELWPGGDEDLAQELHRGYIWNDATGTLDKGNYQAQFLEKGKKLKGKSIWKKGEIKNFPRKRLLAWDLLALTLIKALGEERLELYQKLKVKMEG